MKTTSSEQRCGETADLRCLNKTTPPRIAGRLKEKWACSECGGTNIYEQDGKLRCYDCDGVR